MRRDVAVIGLGSAAVGLWSACGFGRRAGLCRVGVPNWGRAGGRRRAVGRAEPRRCSRRLGSLRRAAVYRRCARRRGARDDAAPPAPEPGSRRPSAGSSACRVARSNATARGRRRPGPRSATTVRSRHGRPAGPPGHATVPHRASAPLSTVSGTEAHPRHRAARSGSVFVRIPNRHHHRLGAGSGRRQLALDGARCWFLIRPAELPPSFLTRSGGSCVRCATCIRTLSPHRRCRWGGWFQLVPSAEELIFSSATSGYYR